MALDDCGLKIQDMEALYCGNLYQANAMVGQRVLQQIGQTGIPVVNCANACATGATAFREAWMAVKAGVYDLVLAVGVEQMGSGLLGGAGGGQGIPKEGLLGSGTMPAVFAEAGMEHARKYGTTFEQFAKVSVKNHHHSTHEPEGDVPDRDAARDGDERRDDRLPEHQADVLGERGRLGGRGDRHREEGTRARAHEARGAREGLGADQRSVAGARPGDARREHLHAHGREEGLRDGRRRPRRTSIWSSCTTASPPPRSCTTRTSGCAARARPGR